MWNKLTAAMARLMLIGAAGLDSEDWTKPLLVFLIGAVWCMVYAIRSYFYEEE